MNKTNKCRKEKVGIVVSNKMEKTIIVTENKRIKHYRYNKSILRSKKYFVHDEKNLSNKGDLVKIIETRPLSKKKRWKLVTIEKNISKRI